MNHGVHHPESVAIGLHPCALEGGEGVRPCWRLSVPAASFMSPGSGVELDFTAAQGLHARGAVES